MFDFSACLPLSDVTLTGNVTDYIKITSAVPSIGYNLVNVDFSVDFKFVAMPDPMTTLTTTYLQFDHTNVSAPAMPNAAKVHVNLAGTNRLSYNSINDITLNIVAPPTIAPIVSQLIYQTYSGGITLTFSCSQPGTMYWALSLNNATLAALKDTDIKA